MLTELSASTRAFETCAATNRPHDAPAMDSPTRSMTCANRLVRERTGRWAMVLSAIFTNYGTANGSLLIEENQRGFV